MAGLLILFAALLSCVFNIILTPIIIRVSDRNKWYDHQDDRKIHLFATSRLGGVGIFLSFLLSILIITQVFPYITGYSIPFRLLSNKNILLFLGFLLIHSIGLVDDFRSIPAVYKMLGQILAGALVVLGGAFTDGIYLPLVGIVIPLGPLSGVITIFWLISISNAVNLVDGMDGLAGTVALLASAGIGMVHLITGNILGAMYSFGLFGSVLAFLFFNRPVARIFMGDSGSLFLGFALASLAFIGAGDSEVAPMHFQAGFIICTTVLIIPITDMIASIFRRIREKRPIYQPDKQHLHHKLLGFGMSVWSILAIVTLLNLIMLGVVVVHSWLFLHGRALTGDIILVSAWAVIILLFLILHYVNKRKNA